MFSELAVSFGLRPEPGYKIGDLVEFFATPERPYTAYLLIKNRRYIRSNGMSYKKWVYDGAILRVEEAKQIIVKSYYVLCIGEDELMFNIAE